MNVTLQNNAGKTKNVILPEKFDLKLFIKAVTECMGSIDGYRLFIDGKQLDLKDDKIFDEQKSAIEDDKTIFVLDRLKGGGYLELSVLIDIILNDLPSELDKLTKKNCQCAVCDKEKLCITVCHGLLCANCLTDYFKGCNLKLKCVYCHSIAPYKDVFITRGFIKSLESYKQLLQLMTNIDCQICTCGALTINETMYPKQKCKQCSRDFCFFCNKTWNDQKMRNVDKFTCHSGNCDYEIRTTFNLTGFMFSSRNFDSIPDRRCCPKCFNQGAYGERCQYHTCKVCNYTFCFNCLKEEADCKKTYGVTSGQKCVEPIKQDYTMFPRLNNSA